MRNPRLQNLYSTRNKICIQKRLKIRFSHFHGNALHDLFQCQHHAKAVLLLDHYAFHPLERPRADARPLPHCQQGVRLGLPYLKSAAQPFYRRIRQRSRLAPRSAHNRQRPWNAQYPYPLNPRNVYENIPGKQRKLKRHPRAVFPLPFRPVKRKVVVNLPMAKVLCHSLLVPRCRIHRIPIHTKLSVGQPAGQHHSARSGFKKFAFMQSFAVLTWVGHRYIVFPRPESDSSVGQASQRGCALFFPAAFRFLAGPECLTCPVYQPACRCPTQHLHYARKSAVTKVRLPAAKRLSPKTLSNSHCPSPHCKQSLSSDKQSAPTILPPRPSSTLRFALQARPFQPRRSPPHSTRYTGPAEVRAGPSSSPSAVSR